MKLNKFYCVVGFFKCNWNLNSVFILSRCSEKIIFFSDASLDETVTNNPGKWSTERIRLLIQLRLEMEAQFRSGRSRHLLWPQVYSKLKSADPSITETLKNVQKKFNNLMLTYKRIKSSSRNVNQSRWEFFDDFDEIMSQFSDTPDENDQSNVRYVNVDDKVDDDSVSFSSDDGGAPSKFDGYKNVVPYKPKSPIKPAATHTQAANGIKSERFTIVHVPKEPEKETNKRKLSIETGGMGGGGNVSKVQKKTKLSTTESGEDVSSWFKEYVKMNERQEQLRCEQHRQLLELERKRIEIETKNHQMLRELVDVVKKFVNK